MIFALENCVLFVGTLSIFAMARNHTRRQHWVPQMYLRNWATLGRFSVLDKLNGRILTNQNTLNFAQEHDFYGFVDLSPVS